MAWWRQRLVCFREEEPERFRPSWQCPCLALCSNWPVLGIQDWAGFWHKPGIQAAAVRRPRRKQERRWSPIGTKALAVSWSQWCTRSTLQGTRLGLQQLQGGAGERGHREARPCASWEGGCGLHVSAAPEPLGTEQAADMKYCCLQLAGEVEAGPGAGGASRSRGGVASGSAGSGGLSGPGNGL